MFLRIPLFCLTITVATCIYCGVGVDIDPFPNALPPNLTMLLGLYKVQCLSNLCPKFVGSQNTELLGQYTISGGWCNEYTIAMHYYYTCSKETDMKPVSINIYEHLRIFMNETVIPDIIKTLPPINGIITCCRKDFCNCPTHKAANSCNDHAFPTKNSVQRTATPNSHPSLRKCFSTWASLLLPTMVAFVNNYNC